MVVALPFPPSKASEEHGAVTRRRYIVPGFLIGIYTAHDLNQILRFGDGEFVLNSFPLGCVRENG